MGKLRDAWEFVCDEPGVVILGVITVAVIVLSCWAQLDDYKQCLKDGNPKYLCRGLIK